MHFKKKFTRGMQLCIVSFVSAYIVIFRVVLKQPRFLIRETTCNDCFLHNFTYLINNENICRTTVAGETIELMIIIFTEHRNYKAREAVRNTWLTYTKSNTASVRYAFLLGKTGNDSDHENIVEENKIHKDILKEDFEDTYRNLTYKTIMGFKWIVTYCARAKFVIKTDDDMFINIPNFLRFLKESEGILRENVVGHCSENAKPNRNVNSKWYVSEKVYQEGKYPGFCSGTGYLLSTEILKKIYNISRSVPFLHLEDVYIGLCLRKVGGRVKIVEGFKPEVLDLDPCTYKGDGLFTAHHITPDMLYTIWKSQCEKSTNGVKPLFP